MLKKLLLFATLCFVLIGFIGCGNGENKKEVDSAATVEKETVTDNTSSNADTDDVPNVVSEKESDSGNSEGKEGIQSDTYTAYMTATNLTVSDLDGDSYKDMPLIPDDLDWINSPQNTEGTVLDGALYRRIGGWLWGMDERNPSWKTAAKYIIGDVPEDYSDFEPYGKSASRYFLYGNYTLDDVISPLLELDSVNVTGNIDHDNYEYHFVIPDLKECAKEMGITETALGYLLAQLNESGQSIIVEANSFSYNTESTNENDNTKGAAAYFEEVPELLTPDSLDSYVLVKKDNESAAEEDTYTALYDYDYSGTDEAALEYLDYLTDQEGLYYAEGKYKMYYKDGQYGLITDGYIIMKDHTPLAFALNSKDNDLIVILVKPEHIEGALSFN